MFKMGSLAETQKQLRQKEDEIERLRRELRERDAKISNLEEEVQTLRSQLDKYQSVITHRPSPVADGPRKQRAQGISAEPQPQATISDRIRKHSKSQV